MLKGALMFLASLIMALQHYIAYRKVYKQIQKLAWINKSFIELFFWCNITSYTLCLDCIHFIGFSGFYTFKTLLEFDGCCYKKNVYLSAYSILLSSTFHKKKYEHCNKPDVQSVNWECTSQTFFIRNEA